MTRPDYMYVKIADHLREHIARGVYPVGGYLPSREQICREFGVASITARAGMQILVEEGLIRIGRGKPAVVLKAPASRQTAATRIVSGDDLATEAYQLGRVADKLRDMALRDGFLHPATLNELHFQYLELVLVADRIWQQRQARYAEQE